MSPEVLELFIPIVFLLIIGGLIGLRMLKPYGNRILDLIEEMNKSRQSALEEERALQRIHDRLDLLAERQDFLESLVESRIAGEEVPEELPGGAGGAGSRGGEESRAAADRESRGAAGDGPPSATGSGPRGG